MRRIITWLAPNLALAALLLLAGGAGARPGGHHGGPPDPLAGLERQLEGLDLDAETREQVFAALDEGRAAARELRQEVRAAHEALRELLEAEEPDEAAVMAQAEVVGAVITEQRKRELATVLRVLSLLDAEQRALLREGRRGRF